MVHGSRAGSSDVPAGTDIDFGIRVKPEQFDQMVSDAFNNPNPGSAKMDTMLHAQDTGILKGSRVGLRDTRNQLEELTGMKTDLSVIKAGGPADQGPSISVPKPTIASPTQAAGAAASVDKNQ